MKNLVLLASVSVLFGAFVNSCGGGKAKGEDDDLCITRFAVSEEILTADRNYMLVSEADTAYLDQYVSLLWPKAFGDADLSVLRDSLVYFCFGDTAYSDADEVIRKFICDTSFLSGEDGAPGYKATPIDSLPAGVDALGCYFNNVTASVSEVDEEKVTYQVTVSSYYGGAHPMTMIRPFTYDLSAARVLDMDNMFTEQGRDSIVPIIVSALARQLDVPVSGLDRAGIFSSQLTYPGQPYIYNNMLYFHYNPYDIAPYSSGMVDVAVYPYEVDRFLKPDVKKLFDVGI